MFSCYLSSSIKFDFMSIKNTIYTLDIKMAMAYVILLEIIRKRTEKQADLEALSAAEHTHSCFLIPSFLLDS